MTDPEMMKRCAEAFFNEGKRFISVVEDKIFVEPFDTPNVIHWNPLHDDAQAMQLVRRFCLGLSPPHKEGGIWAASGDGGGAVADTLNRAIVECVAKMQAAK